MLAPLPHPWHLRLLTGRDGPEFQRLRLQALEDAAEAFLSSWETESRTHEGAFAGELDYAYSPPHFGYYGLFNEERLVGFCQIGRSYLEKQNHVAFIYNLFVDPAYRGQGYARRLVSEVLDQVTTHEGIEAVFLSCAAKNKVGLKFYGSLGFQRCGVKRRSIKWQGEYDDEVEMIWRVMR
jgi:RimJ/RimL family protein N-acetyltransferase